MLFLALMFALGPLARADDPRSSDPPPPPPPVEPGAPSAPPVAEPAPGAPTAPTAPKVAERRDRGGRVGVGIQLLNPGLVSVEGNLRFGRLAGRLAAGPAPYALTLEGVDAVYINPGDMRVAIAPRYYLNKSMTGRYQHALEGLLDYTLFSLDRSHSQTTQQLGIAFNYAGELYLGSKLAFTFGGGPGVVINGNPDAAYQRFAVCNNGYVECSSNASTVNPWIDLSVGLRLYFL